MVNLDYINLELICALCAKLTVVCVELGLYSPLALTLMLFVPEVSPSVTPYILLIGKPYCLVFKTYQIFKHFSLPPPRSNHCHLSWINYHTSLLTAAVLQPQPRRCDLNTAAHGPFKEYQMGFLHYSKLFIGLSKVLFVIDMTLRGLFPMTPWTSPSLLWSFWPPHWPWTFQRSARPSCSCPPTTPWNSFPPNSCMASSFIFFGSLLKNYFLHETYLATLSKISTPTSWHFIYRSPAL